MKFPVITIDAIQVNWGLVLIPFYVVVFLLIIVGLFQKQIPEVAPLIFTAVIAFVMGVIILFVAPAAVIRYTKISEETVALTNQLGYHHVNVTPDNWNFSSDPPDKFVAGDAEDHYTTGFIQQVAGKNNTYILVIDNH